MGSRRRSELKNYFIKGRIPKEEDFQDLIDSTVNLVDDGIEINDSEGLVVFTKENHSAISIKSHDEESEAFWRIKVDDERDHQVLKFKHSMNESPVLSLSSSGSVGIGIDDPLHTLDVNGTVGSHGRINYYRFGEVPADGQWHSIVENLESYSAFEVIANCGEKGAHAMTHAIALCTFGKSKGGINQTQNFFGRSRNRIQLRWDGDYFKYNLQIRTMRPYARETVIKYHVGLLWQ